MKRSRNGIDKIRDQLGDEGFIAFCLGSAMQIREDLDLTAENTTLQTMQQARLEEADWYEAMAMHVRHPSKCDDPRLAPPIGSHNGSR